MTDYSLIETIPNSICSVSISSRDYSITGISDRFLRIRVNRETGEKMFSENRSHAICLKYLVYSKQRYNKIKLENCTLVDRSKLTYWEELVFLIGENVTEYQKVYSDIVKQYMDYIYVKMDSYGNEFSEKMCGYPSGKDEEFYESKDTFWKEELHATDLKQLIETAKRNGIEFSVSLSSEGEYNAIIEMIKDIDEDFTHLDNGPLYSNDNNKRKEEEKQICKPFIYSDDNTTRKEDAEQIDKGQIDKGQIDKKLTYIDRLYIGNEYCLERCPKISTWEKILRAVSRPLTVVLPPIPEEKSTYLYELAKLLTNQEVVVNDWGTYTFLKEKTNQILAGTLLLKARKDPRFQYRICRNEQMRNKYRELQCEQNEMLSLLKENGFTRIEVDRRIQKQSLFPVSYHFPLYQTNTSSFCTLRGLLLEQDRGQQHPVSVCQGLCEKYICSYPKHLHMIGIGNSLFGLDKGILQDYTVLQDMKNKGIDRIVWNGPLECVLRNTHK